MSTTIDHEVQGEQRPTGPSDASLLELVRAGDADAYGELYVRHGPAATSLARYLTRSNHEADDVVADAFARVLRAIRGGAGPTEAFRPYLLTAVRRTAWRRSDEASHTRLAATDDEAEMLDIRMAVEPEDHTDEGLVLRAFQELPERWQLVLWHTEIEGQPPAAVAPLLGLSPNATAALAVRAREGLRQAYLQAHLQSRPADSCRFSVEHLGSFVRDGLGSRDTAKVEAHLNDCDECRELQADLGSLNKALRSVVGPAVLGAGAIQYLQGTNQAASASVEPVAHLGRVAHRLTFRTAVGLAAAAAIVFVTLAATSRVARQPDTASDAFDPSEAVRVTALGPSVVDTALVGTGGATTPGVQRAACDGASLPLTLPEGAVPIAATLVQTALTGQPQTVPLDLAETLSPVTSGDAALVGAGGACVGSLITPLAAAPAGTALMVTFLDGLGDVQALVVPRIVTVVQDALRTATATAEYVNAQVQDYVEALNQAADQLPGADGVTPSPNEPGNAPSGGGTVPPTPSADVPDLPAIPPADTATDVVDDVGGLVDDTTSSVDDLVGSLPG